MVESHKNIYKILFFGLVLILLYVLVWRVFENFFFLPWLIHGLLGLYKGHTETFVSSPKETHPFPRKFISRAITSLAFLLVLTLPFVSVVQVYLWADEYVFPFSLIPLALWILRLCSTVSAYAVSFVCWVLKFVGGGGRAGVILCWVCACAWFHTEVLLLSQFPFPICWSQRLTRREYSVCGKEKEKENTVPVLH